MLLSNIHRVTLSIFLFTFVTIADAQEIRNNEIKDSLHSEMIAEPSSTPITPSYEPIAKPIVDIEPAVPTPADTLIINPRAVSLSFDRPYLTAWKNGGVVGYHGSYADLLSFRNVAGATAIQQWGNMTVTGGLNMSKGIGNGIGIVNGIGGNMTASYRLSDNVILNAFGGMNYNGFMGPAPNMTSYYYGGYVTLLTNNGKWGMDMGVRRIYNSFTGRWETVPMAMPYYNLNGAKLGIDVGGILYSIFSGMAESKNTNVNVSSPDYRGPAIIAPPIDTKPKIVPVETPKWVEKQYDNAR